ncbi:MAG: YajQ family cyclic di-GMP-binding protein [Candidatus Omnitrophota bacterium]|jgi:hypothetical protein
MADFSFDIVSEVDLQEVDNAVNQAGKEIAQRYDFKGSISSLSFDRQEKRINITADDEFKLRAIRDILNTKAAKRGVSLKALVYNDPEKAGGNSVRQKVEITVGIPRDKARELVQIIKDLGVKVQVRIEEDKVRVSGAKKDDLQSVIARLRSVDFSVALGFCNYR